MSEVAKSDAREVRPFLVGSEWREGSGRTFESICPIDGSVAGVIAEAGADDVDAAVTCARAALENPKWSELRAHQRARLLYRMSELIERDAERLAQLQTRDNGKTIAESRMQAMGAVEAFRYYAAVCEVAESELMSPRGNYLSFSTYEPVGVVAAITPWNFPAAMMTRKLGPAMAAGCTSIVKPASATPLTAAMMLRAIEDAGAPPGVVNLVTSRSAGMVAETIFGDRRVRKISFTGSTEVGKDLIRASADQVKRLSLELGGHAPYLIFDDADLEEAADGLIASKFRNAGQTCVCANRVYVQKGIYKEFVDLLAQKVAKMVVGPGDRPGVTVGPLIDSRGVDKADEHVQDAIARGARLVTGGGRLTDGEFARGSFYAPTVLDGVTPEMLISYEETFGPVAGITQFAGEEEALRLANDSVYGLCAYFHTRDYARLLRVAEKLDYGIVGANTGIISAASAPFGGVKESGYGREGGSVGIDEYLDTKYVLVAGVGI